MDGNLHIGFARCRGWLRRLARRRRFIVGEPPVKRCHAEENLAALPSWLNVGDLPGADQIPDCSLRHSQQPSRLSDTDGERLNRFGCGNDRAVRQGSSPGVERACGRRGPVARGSREGRFRRKGPRDLTPNLRTTWRSSVRRRRPARLAGDGSLTGETRRGRIGRNRSAADRQQASSRPDPRIAVEGESVAPWAPRRLPRGRGACYMPPGSFYTPRETCAECWS